MAFNLDFSDLPYALHDFAVRQFTWQGFLNFDLNSKILVESEDANSRRLQALEHDKDAYWAWWLRFGAGFENLVKAVILKHEICLLGKKDIAEKASGRKRAHRDPKAAHVYSAVLGTRLTVLKNAWLKDEFDRLGISHPLEINSGTLGSCKKRLDQLTSKKVINTSEQGEVATAIEVLSDMRRNVDAHVFLKMQVGRSINGDLLNVYLPACNILFRAF